MMKIIQIIAGLFAVLFSVTAWYQMSDAVFWNYSHTISFTLLLIIGVWLLWKTAEEVLDSL